MSCTATMECLISDCDHIETQTVKSTMQTTSATCNVGGTVTYTATFTKAGFAVQRKTVTSEKLPHEYGETVYTWNIDYSICTAEKKCTRANCSHSVKESGDVTSKTTAATCKDEGKIVYTANFVAFASDSKIKVLPVTDNHVNEVVIGKAPSCTETGLTDGEKCSVCGKVFREQTVLDVINHTYDDIYDAFCNVCDFERDAACRHDNKITTPAVAPTCTADGKTVEVKCLDCQEILVKSEAEAALGHKWIDATCSVPKTCERCDATDGSALGHNYEGQIVTYTWNANLTQCTASVACKNNANHIDSETVNVVKSVQDPTCTDAGLKTWTATFTKPGFETKTKEEAIASLGHKYTSVVTDPTCLEGGYTTHTCTNKNCGDSYTDTPVKATGHKYGDWYGVEGTNTHRHDCVNSDCKYFETESHNPIADDNDCTTAVYCSVCNSVTTVANDAHVFGDWYPVDGKQYHEHKCDNCDVTETEDHIAADNNNCMSNTVCSVCNALLVEGNDKHNWNEWTANGDKHTHNCINPNCKGSETLDHTPVEDDNDCTTATLCTGCNAVLVAAKDHTPSEAVVENKVDSTCSAVGSYDSVVYCSVCHKEISRESKTIELKAHSFGEVTYTWTGYTGCTATRECGECEHSETATAEITNTQTDATCLADGSIVYTATFTADWCAGTRTESEVIPNLDHEFKEKIEDEAHFKSAGNCQVGNEYWYDCTRCDAKSTEDYFVGDTKGDHNMSNAWTTEDGYHFHKCTIENCTHVIDKEACSHTNACDTDCNVCGATRDVPDHVYTAVCDADCNVCGETRIPEDHTYDNACDASCNVCGDTRAITHDWKHGVCQNGCGTPFNSTVIFDFGENGEAVHADGSEITTSKDYTENGVTLTISNLIKVYDKAFDALGNSCLKLGTSKGAGSFEIVVPNGVTKVTIYVAQYKEDATTVTINGVKHTITTSSNKGEYTAIEIDTTNIEKIEFSVDTKRCMINRIEFTSTFAHEHIGGENSCKELAVCDICGNTYGEYAAHTEEDVAAVAPKCNAVGYTAGKYCTTCEQYTEGHEEVAVVDHSWENNACIWCGTSNHTCNFNVVVEVIAPTCTTGGYTTYKCYYDGCTQTENKDETSATGHTTVDKDQGEDLICDVEGCGAAIDPPADSTLTIKQAIALGTRYVSESGSSYTEVKYYVTATVYEVTNLAHGNMTLVDANNNKLGVYGSYDADGTNKGSAMENQPTKGDTITIYGVIGAYYSTVQMNNGWITAHTSHTCDWADATCQAPKTCKLCGVTEGEVIDHNYVDDICTMCGTQKPAENAVEVTLKHNSASTTNMTGNNDAEKFFGLDTRIFSVIGSKGTNGNYPGLNVDGGIRLYSGGNSSITVSVADGYIIQSIQIVFSSGYVAGCKISVGTEEVLTTDSSSATTITANINANSFVIEDVGSAQVRFKEVIITYAQTCEHSSEETPTCQTAVTCSKCGGQFYGDHDYVEVAEKVATCFEAGKEAGTQCSICNKVLSGLEVIPATGNHIYGVDGICTTEGCGKEDPASGGDAPTIMETTTITFAADKADRISYSTSEQVWKNGGLTFTNKKAGSTSNVADYSNPVRLYASSSITIEGAGMETIKFTCSSSSYATALKNSIGNVSGATVTVSGSAVTVTFVTAVDSFSIAKLTAQVRMNSITVN